MRKMGKALVFEKLQAIILRINLQVLTACMLDNKLEFLFNFYEELECLKRSNIIEINAIEH